MSQGRQWTLKEANALFEKPFFELLYEAQTIHRQHFDPQQVQISTLLSIKTGAAWISSGAGGNSWTARALSGRC